MNEGPAERRPFSFGVPVIATLVVLTAVLAMIGLGFWQLARAQEKEAALAIVERNIGAPPLALSPDLNLSDHLLRPVTVNCRAGSPTRVEGAGKFGFRVIADCLPVGFRQTLPVQLGTSRRLAPSAIWQAGKVTGYLAQAPDNRSLLRRLFDRTPVGMMVVAKPPLMGLADNPAPDLADIPNNHRSYAIQWFSFAAIALLIYALALRARSRR